MVYIILLCPMYQKNKQKQHKNTKAKFKDKITIIYHYTITMNNMMTGCTLYKCRTTSNVYQ